MKKIIPFVKEIEFKTMISRVTSISLEHTLRAKEDNLISGHFILEGTYKMTQASQIDEDFSYKIPVDIEIDDKYDTTDVILDIDDFTYEVIDEERLKLNISLCIDNLEEKEIPVLIEEEPVLETFDISENGNEEKIRNDEVLDDLFLDTSTKEELIIDSDDSYNNDNDCIEKDIETNVEAMPIYQAINTNFEYTPVNSNNSQNSNSLDNVGVNSLFSSFKDNAETFKTYCVYIVKEEDTINSILSKYNISKDDLEEYNNLEDIKTGSKVIIPSSKNE